MSKDSEYTCDREFMKLMTRCSEINLTEAALELARDAYPTLEFGPTLDWIQARADEIAGPVATARTERDALGALADCLAGRHDIRGDRESFERADGSYLNRVIETRRGIPISISALYMAVAAPAGICLQGVSAPGHFLTRYESMEGPLFVDAFAGGAVLTYDECVERLCRESDLSRELAESALDPVGPRTIILRMLNNLKVLHAKQGNWPAAWIVQHRLTSLRPTSYVERRDMGLISLKVNRPGLAVDLLEACLKACPSDETKILEQHLSEARRQLALWN